MAAEDNRGTHYADLPITEGETQNTDPRSTTGLGRLWDGYYRRIGGVSPRPGQRGLFCQQTTAPVQFRFNSTIPARLFRYEDRVLIERGGVLHDLKENVTGGEYSAGQGPLSRYYVSREPVYANNLLTKNMQVAIGNGYRIVSWTQRDTSTTFSCWFEIFDDLSGALLVGPKYAIQADAGGAQCVWVPASGKFALVVGVGTNALRLVMVGTDGALGTPSAMFASTSLPAFRICASPTDQRVFVATGSSAGDRIFYGLNTAVNPPTVATTLTTALVPAGQTLRSFAMYCEALGRMYVAIGASEEGDAFKPQRVFVEQIDCTTTPARTAIGTAFNEGGATNDSLLAGRIPWVNVIETTVGDVWVGATFASADAGTLRQDLPITRFTRLTKIGSIMSLVTPDPACFLAGYAIESDLWKEYPTPPPSGAAQALVFCCLVQSYSSAALTMAGGWNGAGSPRPSISTTFPSFATGVVVHVNRYTAQTVNVGTPAARTAPMATYGVGQMTYNRMPTANTSPPEGVSVPDEWGLRYQSQQAFVIQRSGPYGTPEFVSAQGFVQRVDAPNAIHLVRVQQVIQRQGVELAGRLFLTGGTPSLYDGRTCRPWGFLDVPYAEISVPLFGGGTPNGTYSWALHAEFIDANGDILPGPPLVRAVAAPGGDFSLSIVFAQPHADTVAPNDGVRIAIFQTNTNSAGPLRRITPANGLAPASPFTGNFYGPVLDTFPTIYTDGNTFAADPLPSTRFAVAWQNRIVCAGTDDDSIYFSTETEQGVVNYFTLLLRLPPFAGGDVNGLGVIDDKLIVFKRNSVWLLQNTLPANNGEGGSVPIPVAVATDTGCIDGYSIVSTPEGLIFRSARGFYLLDRGLNLSFVGDGVTNDTNFAAIVRAPMLVPEHNHVRFDAPNSLNDAGPVLVWDYLTKTWARWTYNGTGGGNPSPPAPTSQVRTKNGRYWVNATTMSESLFVYRDDPDSYMDRPLARIVQNTLQTGWVKPTGQLQGYFRAHAIHILGEYGGPHRLHLRVFADFDAFTPVYERFIDVTANPPEGYQWRFACSSFRTSRMQAISVRINIEDIEGASETGAPTAVLSGIALEFTPLGAQRRIPATQKG